MCVRSPELGRFPYPKWGREQSHQNMAAALPLPLPERLWLLSRTMWPPKPGTQTLVLREHPSPGGRDRALTSNPSEGLTCLRLSIPCVERPRITVSSGLRSSEFSVRTPPRSYHETQRRSTQTHTGPQILKTAPCGSDTASPSAGGLPTATALPRPFLGVTPPDVRTLEPGSHLPHSPRARGLRAVWRCFRGRGGR